MRTKDHVKSDIQFTYQPSYQPSYQPFYQPSTQRDNTAQPWKREENRGQNRIDRPAAGGEQTGGVRVAAGGLD